MATAVADEGTLWRNARCTFLSPAVYGPLSLRCNRACCTAAAVSPGASVPFLLCAAEAGPGMLSPAVRRLPAPRMLGAQSRRFFFLRPI